MKFDYETVYEAAKKQREAGNTFLVVEQLKELVFSIHLSDKDCFTVCVAGRSAVILENKKTLFSAVMLLCDLACLCGVAKRGRK